jgi:hypothetical protein
LPDHHAPCRLAREEQSFQIDGERQVVVLFANVLGQVARRDSGVVDQDVDPPEMFDRSVHGTENFVHAGHVHLQRQSLPAECQNLLDEAAALVHVAQSKRDISSRVGECERDRAAQATGGAGDEGYLPGQIKTRKCAVSFGGH